MKPLRIALSKGRIFDETLPLFAAAGIRPGEDPGRSRKLIIRSEPAEGATGVPATSAPVDFLIVRASDVPTYVQHGGADLGVVGKDVLMEHGGQGLLEPLDLRIARCRLMVAGHPGTVLDGAAGGRGASGIGQRLRVATKYAECARRHFAAHHRQVEIIKLYGSMELAPLVGLADLIVDVVDTGSTLRANHLEPLEHIADISSRLVVNRASMKTRHREIETLVRRLREAVARASGDGDAPPGADASGACDAAPTTPSAASSIP